MDPFTFTTGAAFDQPKYDDEAPIGHPREDQPTRHLSQDQAGRQLEHQDADTRYPVNTLTPPSSSFDQRREPVDDIPQEAPIGHPREDQPTRQLSQDQAGRQLERQDSDTRYPVNTFAPSSSSLDQPREPVDAIPQEAPIGHPKEDQPTRQLSQDQAGRRLEHQDSDTRDPVNTFAPSSSSLDQPREPVDAIPQEAPIGHPSEDQPTRQLSQDQSARRLEHQDSDTRDPVNTFAPSSSSLDQPREPVDAIPQEAPIGHPKEDQPTRQLSQDQAGRQLEHQDSDTRYPVNTFAPSSSSLDQPREPVDAIPQEAPIGHPKEDQPTRQLSQDQAGRQLEHQDSDTRYPVNTFAPSSSSLDQTREPVDDIPQEAPIGHPREDQAARQLEHQDADTRYPVNTFAPPSSSLDQPREPVNDIPQQASTQPGDGTEVHQADTETTKVSFKERVIGTAQKTKGTLLRKPELKEHGQAILDGETTHEKAHN